MRPVLYTLKALAIVLLTNGAVLINTPAIAAVTKTELAGRSLAVYPFFEYVKAINANSNVQIAIDPSRFPAITGVNCDIYIVIAKGTNGWNADNTLTDVTAGGKMNVTFTGALIQGNTFTVANAGELSADAGLGLGVGYDVIIDVNKNGLLDGIDFIDGRNNESGFYMVHNTCAAGPKAVTALNYNISNAVAATYGIPGGFEAENLFFPTDVAGVMAANGGKKLPLIIVSHGNGHQYIWYDHIGNHLASYGYVVMSHPNNTVPGPVSASTTTLAHTEALIDQINNGAIAGAAALTGNIDVSRIVFIGHSRGAEGVAIAYDRMFDGTYVPVNYNISSIKLISSMLPTDFEVYLPLGTDIHTGSNANPNNVNYHLWTASGDDDVDGSAGAPRLQTYHLHDRATGNRQSTTVQGTGHAWFHNGPDVPNDWFTGPCPIGKANTHLVELGYLLPLVKRYVDDNIPSIDFLTRQYESFRPIGIPNDPCIVVSNEYRDATPNTAANPQKTVIIDDYQSNTATHISSSGAAVNFDVQNLSEDRLDDNNNDFSWINTDPFNGATQAGASDDSRGVVFDWSNSNHFYEWIIPVAERNFTDNLFLSFRGAQATQHPNNAAIVGDLTFKVTLVDGQAIPKSSSISIGAYGGGFEKSYQRSGGWHNEMETIRIRLTDFLNNASGIDLSNIVSIRLDVGPAHGSASGRIVIDELMLTNDRAVYDANANGDPHIKTVNGVNYDFQGAGEYTLLRDGNDYEIQVRQTPVTTASPILNGYTGLRSCVSVNTALSAKVGTHRISYQPDGPIQEQATMMRLRVDGILKDINALGMIDLGPGGRVSKIGVGNGIEVDFPNGSKLIATQHWWGGHNIAYLNVSVLNTPATEGVAGLIEAGQWLPALSDGTFLGPKPASLTDRYKQLNDKFSSSWRIRAATSLFDYAPGTSTATFTVKEWPVENADSCKVPAVKIIKPVNIEVARRACSGVTDRDNRNNCIADVMVTGEIGFARSYLIAQRIEQAGTKTEVYAERKMIKQGDTAIFTAIVKRSLTNLRLMTDGKDTRAGIGSIRFYINGKPMDRLVPLDRFGQAKWIIPQMKSGEYRVGAEFIPDKNDKNNLPSRSLEMLFGVR